MLTCCVRKSEKLWRRSRQAFKLDSLLKVIFKALVWPHVSGRAVAGHETYLITLRSAIAHCSRFSLQPSLSILFATLEALIRRTAI